MAIGRINMTLLALMFSLSYPSWASADPCDLGASLVRLLSASQCREAEGPNACLSAGLGLAGVAVGGVTTGLAGNRGIAGLLEREPLARDFLREVQQAVGQHAEDYRQYASGNREGKSLPILEERLHPIKIKYKRLLGSSPFATEVLNVARTQAGLEVTIKTRLELGRLRAEIKAKRAALTGAGPRDRILAAEQANMERGIARLEGRERLLRQDLARSEKSVVKQTRTGAGRTAVRAAGLAAAAVAVSAAADPVKIASCNSALTNADVQLLTGVIEYRHGLAGSCERGEISSGGVMALVEKVSEGSVEPSEELCQLIGAQTQKAESWINSDQIAIESPPTCGTTNKVSARVAGRKVELAFTPTGPKSMEVRSALIPGSQRRESQFTLPVNFSQETTVWTLPQVQTVTWADLHHGGGLDAPNLVRFYREECASARELIESDLNSPAAQVSQKCSVGRALFVAQHVMPAVQLACGARGLNPVSGQASPTPAGGTE